LDVEPTEIYPIIIVSAGFSFAPLRTGMETRLALNSLHNSFINMCKTATNVEK